MVGFAVFSCIITVFYQLVLTKFGCCRCTPRFWTSWWSEAWRWLAACSRRTTSLWANAVT